MKRLLGKVLRRSLDLALFEKFSDRVSQPELGLSAYNQIFETAPVVIPQSSNVELHMLVCERDFLRSFWALKSFFYYSRLSPRLVIQSDGSLTPASLNLYHQHFPNCVVHHHNDDQIRDTLSGYPMCQFFLSHHAIAKKLLHPLLLSQSEYLLIMDSDILWFKQSKAIVNCVKSSLPFYVYGGAGAYVRSQKFMEERLGLYPADNVNSGIIGYQKSKFLDLKFIESAIQKMVHVPPALISESIGYVDDYVDINSDDINQTLCWWVMEQTIYALLFGRESNRQALKYWDHRFIIQWLGDLHQFVNSPIIRGTSLIHYISDSSHNQFFPVGVQHLIKRRFLEKIS